MSRFVLKREEDEQIAEIETACIVDEFKKLTGNKYFKKIVLSRAYLSSNQEKVDAFFLSRSRSKYMVKIISSEIELACAS